MTDSTASPLITIITIAKDNEQGLLKTLESLQSQDFELWSLVIVVGKSKDGTLATAHKFKNVFKRVTIIEQSNSGIYEAMNLGMSEVQNEFVWFMNSGDVFFNSESLKTATNEAKSRDCALLVGHHRIQGNNRKFRNTVGELNPLSFAFSRRGSCHQAMVFKTKFLTEKTTYDTKFKYCADYKLALSLVVNHKSYRIKETLCEVEPGGVSDVNLRKVHKEKHDIRLEILGDTIWLKAFSFIWIFLLFSKINLRGLISKTQGDL